MTWGIGPLAIMLRMPSVGLCAASMEWSFGNDTLGWRTFSDLDLERISHASTPKKRNAASGNGDS